MLRWEWKTAKKWLLWMNMVGMVGIQNWGDENEWIPFTVRHVPISRWWGSSNYEQLESYQQQTTTIGNAIRFIAAWYCLSEVVYNISPRMHSQSACTPVNLNSQSINTLQTSQLLDVVKMHSNSLGITLHSCPKLQHQPDTRSQFFTVSMFD